MFNIIRKTLYDKRSFIFGWGIGLAFMGFLMMVFYPSFHSDSGLDQLVNSLPPAFKGLVGDLNNLKTLPGYIGSQLFDIRIPIFVSISSIILAVGLTVSEEEKGYIRTLTALPTSRTNILIGKWLALTLVCLLVNIATIAGLYLGIMMIGETLAFEVALRLGLMTWLLSTCVTSIVFGIGMATGSRALTMGVGVVYTIGSFILTTFAKSVDWLKPYEFMSLFHYFPAVDIANGDISLYNIIIFSGLIFLSVIFGILFFRRRDVR